jgi:hypothetical protein
MSEPDNPFYHFAQLSLRVYNQETGRWQAGVRQGDYLQAALLAVTGAAFECIRRSAETRFTIEEVERRVRRLEDACAALMKWDRLPPADLGPAICKLADELLLARNAVLALEAAAVIMPAAGPESQTPAAPTPPPSTAPTGDAEAPPERGWWVGAGQASYNGRLFLVSGRNRELLDLFVRRAARRLNVTADAILKHCGDNLRGADAVKAEVHRLNKHLCTNLSISINPIISVDRRTWQLTDPA